MVLVAAVAQIQRLALELPHAMGANIKKQTHKKHQRKMIAMAILAVDRS